MADPPFEPAVQLMSEVRSPAPMEPVRFGAAGVVYGVPATPVEAAPAPITFTARIFTEYAVPFVKPVIEFGLTMSAHVTQLTPLLIVY